MEESYTAAHTPYGFGLWQKERQEAEFTSESMDKLCASFLSELFLSL